MFYPGALWHCLLYFSITFELNPKVRLINTFHLKQTVTMPQTEASWATIVQH